MSPSEKADEDWFEDIVETDILSIPVQGGGTREIELDYDFVEMEEEINMIGTEDFIKRQSR